jgi:hypothetical protein
MVDNATTQILEYKFFRGLNKRDDENNLPIGQTPNAQNFEIVKQSGLKKRKGFSSLFDEYDMSYSWKGATNYTTLNGNRYYIGINYPSIFLINRDNGTQFSIHTSLNGTGNPFFIPLIVGQTMLVDGANAPRLINGTTSTTVTWPPNYSASNSTKLNESANTTASNPNSLGTDIWYPSFGAYYENRVWLSGDKLAPYRIYVSKAFNFTAFGDNSGATWDIAFFVDIPSNSPITALKIINNRFLVVYCEREIFVVTGKFPPGSGFPSPAFEITSLNQSVGCLNCNLIVERGNNDHFFIANNGIIYTLESAQNFQDIKPNGLSSKIFPLFEPINNETFQRGKLVNHKIKGELQFWYPSQNYLRFPDQRLIYNYSDSDQDEEWSLDTKFGDFFLTDTFVDDQTNELILVTPRNFYRSDSGLNYAGNQIDMIYQLSTLDFGDPDINKEIVEVTIYASNKNDTPTTVYLYHLWDNQQSGYTPIVIPSSNTSVYGEAIYNTSTYASFAGTQFNKIDVQIANKQGKIFKSKLRHTEDADIFIHSIIFRYKTLGR